MSDALAKNPEVFLSQADARTNEYGRNRAGHWCLAGHTVRDVAAQFGISRTTAYKWIARFRAEDVAGHADPVEPNPEQPAAGGRTPTKPS